MEETYLPAFRHCVMDAQVEAVMGAYNRTNGEPCCASKPLMELLRETWGFQGHFVSDCWAIADFHNGHKVTSEPVESVKLTLEMGCDLNCGCTYQHILNAYEKGMITDEMLDRSVVRVFTTRYLLGIMGEGSEFDSIPYTMVECPEHLELAQLAARRACVLLKNDGLLPLNPDTVGTVGVIGPNANSRVCLVGNYHGTASRYITALEGIQDAMAGHGRVLYSEGCHMYKDRVDVQSLEDDKLTEAVTVAKHSDVVVLVLGLDEYLEGEEGENADISDCGDKRSLLLPPSQRRLLDTVLEMGKPTVVLLMAGSSIDLSVAQEKANAVMLGWYPGAGGGKAIADLLFGKASPSGKLPLTFYREEALAEMPDFTDYSLHNRTYRYYTGTPLYPFGYGLTYGDVAATDLYANTEGAYVTVENRGRATEDVIQLYIRDQKSPFAPENPILCGFQRIFLDSGEVKQFYVPIDSEALTVVTEEGKRISGSGEWEVFAGLGQPDARTEALTGKKAVSVKITR